MRKFITFKGACVAAAACLFLPLAAGTSHAAHAQRGAAVSSLSGDIVFWHAYNTTGPENVQLITKVLPAFNKLYPNITVHSQDIPYASFLQKLVASVAGGNGPDVVRSDIIWMPQLAKIGAIATTDGIMAARKSQFYAAPVATNYYQGHYYGLPLDTNTRVLIYNKAIFAKAGITQAPTTTGQFTADATKIASLGKNIFGYAEGGFDAWNLWPWLYSFGGSVTNASYTQASGYLNGAKTVAALQYLVTLKDKGLLSPSLLGGGLQTSDAMGKNQAGMILDGPWMPPIFKAAYPNLQLGLAPVPAGPDGHSASVVGGEDIVLMKSSQNAAASRAFIQFMTSPQAQVLMGQVGQMPTLRGVANNPTLPPYFKVFDRQIATAAPRTISPNYVKIDTALTDAFNRAFRHQATVKAALDSAAAQIDLLLK